MNSILRNNKIWHCVFFFSALIAFGACNSDEGDQNLIEDQLIEDYLQEMELLDTTQRDDSGVYYQILKENPSGASPSDGNILSIYYTANAANEEVFDAHENNGTNDPVRLQYNTGSVIPIGLDHCLRLLKQGETGVFYLPPSLAYGELDDLSAQIPPNSVIRMVIELVSIETEATVHDQQIASIDQFIIDQNLNDSIWADIDSVMTPVDSIWVANMDLTSDSVMVPIDSIWYDVAGGGIPVDSVFHFVDSVQFLSSGIYYKKRADGIEGTRIAVGELASIQYQLYTLDSYPNNPIDGTGGGTFDYFLQQGVVITGLDAGIFVMEHGERAILIVPSNQAYLGGVFVIPSGGVNYFVEAEIIPSYTLTVKPFDVLVFDVTLLPPPN